MIPGMIIIIFNNIYPNIYKNEMKLFNEQHNKKTQRNEKWTRFFFRQVIHGLSQVHTSGIAHLDMKIDNVLLDVDDEGT